MLSLTTHAALLGGALLLTVVAGLGARRKVSWIVFPLYIAALSCVACLGDAAVRSLGLLWPSLGYGSWDVAKLVLCSVLLFPAGVVPVELLAGHLAGERITRR